MSGFIRLRTLLLLMLCGIGVLTLPLVKVWAHGRQGPIQSGGGSNLAPTLVYVNGGLFECTAGWQPYSTATGYTVWRSTSPTSGFAQIFSGTSFPTDAGGDLYYCDQSCAGGHTTYYYYVTATVGSGTSGNSNILSGISSSDPTASITATGGNALVRVTCSMTGSGALNVMHATSASGPWTTVGSVSNGGTFTDGSLTNGTRYYYVLATQNGNQTGGFASTIVSSTPRYTSNPIDIIPNPANGVLPDPMTFPSWMEHVAPTDAPDAPGGDTDTASGGPSSVLSVNLAHGVVDIDGGPDLVVSNPAGPDVSFERRYRTALAAGNLASPGMAPGWTHNWDYRIVLLQPNTWGPILLVYPNGATDTLTPSVDNNGNLTSNTLGSTAGTPYVASGVPSSTTGVWTSITLQHNGNESETLSIPSGDTNYRLTSTAEANGSQLLLNYQNACLTEIDSVGVDSVHHTLLTLGYSESELETINDPSTGYNRFYYYANGELVNVSNIGGQRNNEWGYTYTNMAGQPYIQAVTTQDPQGASQTATVGYETSTGRASSLTDAKGDARNYVYSNSGTTTVGIAGSVGNSDSYQDLYDPTGREVSSKNAAGDLTQLTYGAADPSMVTGVQPPLGNPELITPSTDGHNNPVTITEPYGNGVNIQWQYPSWAPLGIVTQVQEFGQGGVIKGATSYSYYTPSDAPQPVGYLKSVTLPRGGVTTYTYTPMGSLASVQGPVTRLTYSYTDNGPERLGLPSSVSDRMNLTTRFVYDANGRLTKTEDPMGFDVSASYNQYGQTTNVNLPLQQAFQFSHAVDGKAPNSALLNGVTVGSSTFDQESGGKTATDANGHTNLSALDGQFGLNGLTNGNNQLMHQFNPRTSARALDTTIGTGAKSISHTSIFDQNGNLSSVSGSDSRTVTIVPNSADLSLPALVTTFDPATNSQVQNQYAYDPFGRVLEVSGNGGSHSYTYDAEDHVTSDTGSNGFRRYTYNLDGTRASMNANHYTYDDDDRLITITVDTGSQFPIIINYSYDNDARVTAMRSQAMTTLYTYNALGQLTSLYNLTPDGYFWPGRGVGAEYTEPNGVEHTIINGFTDITYNTLGNRTHMNFIQRRYINVTIGNFSQEPLEMVPGSATWTYDAGGRLTGETWTGDLADSTGWGYLGQHPPYQPSLSNSYAYDGAGNLTVCRGQNQSIDLGSDQATASSGSTFLNAPPVYNSTGEMTTIQTAYSDVADDGYSAYGVVTAGFDAEGKVTGFGGGSSFNYDPNGLLIQTSNSNFEYDGEQRIYSEVSGEGQFYVWGPTGLVLSYGYGSEGPGMQAYAFDPQGNAVDESSIFVASGAWYYDFNREPNNQAGGFFGATFYDAYGNLLWKNRANELGNIGYKAQYGYWSELGPYDYGGLYYCHHRWYDSNIGRWISRDPSGLDGGVNTYAYCGGDPVLGVDPSGLDWREFFQGMLSGAVGTIKGAADGVVGWYTFRSDQDGFMGWGLPGILDPGGYGLHQAKGAWAGVSDLTRRLWRGDDGAKGELSTIALLFVVGHGVGGDAVAGDAAEMAPVRINNAAGNAFRDSAAQAHNFTPGEFSGQFNGARFRFDGVNRIKGIYYEVKAKDYVCLTRQIRAQIGYAAQNGFDYSLIIRRGGKVSGPLRQLMQAHNFNILYH